MGVADRTGQQFFIKWLSGLAQHPTRMERWIKCFEQTWFKRLREGERVGLPRRMDPVTWKKVEKGLRQEPRQLGYAQNLWDGKLLAHQKLLAHHLSRAYGLDLGVRQCQRLFRAMRFRRRKPRPLIAYADAEAQWAFKKFRYLAADPALDLWSLD